MDDGDSVHAGLTLSDEKRLACARTDRMLEEIFRKYGVLDIGVPAVRELRDVGDAFSIPESLSGGTKCH